MKSILFETSITLQPYKSIVIYYEKQPIQN